MRRYQYTVAMYGERARKVYLSVTWLVLVPTLQSLFTGCLTTALVFLLAAPLISDRILAFWFSTVAGLLWTIGHTIYLFERHLAVVQSIEAILEREARAAQTPVRVEVASDGGRVLRYGKLPSRPEMLRLAALTFDGMKPTAREWAAVFGDKTLANEWQQTFAKENYLRQQGAGGLYEWTEKGLELLENYYHPAARD